VSNKKGCETLENLSRVDLEQMLSYLENRERYMWYYGNRAYFEKRHIKIKTILEVRINELRKSE